MKNSIKIPAGIFAIVAFVFFDSGAACGAAFSWSDVSGKGVKNGLVSDRKAEETNITVSSNGNIFAAYQYNNGKVQVKKFDGTQWIDLADANNPGGLISAGRGENPVLAARNGVVYAAFMDYANGARARVKKWDGSIWSDLSDAAYSAGLISAMKGFEPVLCFDRSGENLYAAFRDEANGEKIKVMRWSAGSGWSDASDAGNPGGLISAGVASEVELKASKTNDDIYAAFEDLANGGRVRVKKWDGSEWRELGGLVSSIAGYSPSIDTDTAENLYLVYTGKNAKNTYIHKWDGNSWANVGDGVAVAGKTIESAITIDERDVLYLAYSQKTKGSWRVRAKILKDSIWLDAKDGKSQNISKGKGKGDPSLAALGNRLYMSFTDARKKNKARVKTLNFEP